MFEPNLPNINSLLSNIKTPEINVDPLEYEDSIFKDMANDIISSQSRLEEKLDLMIEENKKSDKANSKIAKWTLIVALLTLGATLAGVIIQLL